MFTSVSLWKHLGGEQAITKEEEIHLHLYFQGIASTSFSEYYFCNTLFLNVHTSGAQDQVDMINNILQFVAHTKYCLSTMSLILIIYLFMYLFIYCIMFFPFNSNSVSCHAFTVTSVPLLCFIYTCCCMNNK